MTVIVLNWNGRAYLEACLAAILSQSYPPDRVVLVDNGSSDDSVAFVRSRFPQVDIHENGGNVGFAAGNNVALRELSTPIAVLVNPDVVLSPDCLAALREAMAADQAIAIAGCKLWFPGSEIIQYAGGYITQPQAFPGHFGVGERDERQHDIRRDVEYAIGAAAAIRRSALDQIGLMDEGFYLFFEDVDLCTRARQAGWRVTYIPEATGDHIESATTHKGTFAYWQRFHSGRWRYLLKHFPLVTITGETLPSEEAWLDQLGAGEKRAVGLAYVATRRQLPSIWAARARDGGDAPTAEEQETVRAGLKALEEHVRQRAFDDQGLSRLSAAAVLQEPPFTSGVPVLGSLITWFRTAWNNVASRWYVGHYVAQQNEFNRLAVDQIRQYESELSEQLALLEEQVVITVELQERIERLEMRLDELRRAKAGG